MRMWTRTAATLLTLVAIAEPGAQTAPPAADPMQAPPEQSGGSHSSPGVTGAEPQGTGEFVDEAVKDSQKAQQEDQRKVDQMIKDSVKETEQAPSGTDATRKIPPATPGP